MKASFKLKSWTGAIAAIFLTFAFILVFSQTITNWRLDLTQGKLYTLSEGTKETLDAIDEPIRMRFYFSKRIKRSVPMLAQYAVRVQDLLEEYQSLSKGKIKVEILDPEPYSDTEDQAVAFGLQGLPIDTAGGAIYFGLAATNAVDGKEIVPFFDPEREKFLEYDLTKMIHTLANPTKKIVRVMSSLETAPQHPAMGGRQQGAQISQLLEQMKQFFDVKTLGLDAKDIPEDTSVLMLIHPTELSDDTLYAIDQYALKGGKVLAFVDPYAELSKASSPQNPYMPPQEVAAKSSVLSLSKLFDAWGVKVDDAHIVGDRKLARAVNAGGGMSRVQTLPYLPWISLRAKNFNDQEPVTGDLKVINMASAGHVALKEGSKLEFTPLLQSSKDAGLIDKSKMKTYPDPEGLLEEFKATSDCYAFAARLRGEVESAFKDKAQTKGHAAKGMLNAVVVADVDMLDNRLWVRVQNFFGRQLAMPHANNADFVVNALEHLTGSNALIGLRSRGTSDRPFTVLEDIRGQAEAKYRAKEKSLQETLKETEAKLSKMQRGEEGSALTLSGDQKKAIKAFRAQVLEVRKELRKVKLALKKDIDRLENMLQFINIGAMPLIVLVLAIIMGVRRYRRAQR